MSAALFAFLGLAALAANLPFMAERILFLLPNRREGGKAFGWRLLELVLLYLLMVGVGLWLESRMGPLHPKKLLNFYVPTFALFLIAAFPGFVIKYFWRKPGM
ncbi:DUF2818 family protein [Chitinimonas sp.]|uniref:DUF2818 family protein n=1 Tax=Chitinimonas sp. TaxID=1934313 RepID=UPI002F91DAA4